MTMILVVSPGFKVRHVAAKIAKCALWCLLLWAPTARAQSASVSKPRWKSAFRLAALSSSSLLQPVPYYAWHTKTNRPNPSLDLRGGVLIQSPQQSEAACRLIGYDENPNTLAMEWQMNAPKFELLCAPTGGSWRVMVRDTNVSRWTVLGQWSSAGWTAPRVQAFADATNTRRARRFRVEYANQLAWGIRLEKREPIVARPPVPFPRRVVWCGDSFVEGVHSPSLWQGFAGVASAIEGLDAHFDASGSTGYLYDGLPELKRSRYVKRLSNVVASNPSVVVVYGSINDLRFPTSQVVRAATEYWKALRRAFPNAQIIVIGPIRMGARWPTKALSDALRHAATQQGLAFIDASDWVSGTGKADHPRGDGNADTFLSSDGAHPTAAGHLFLGQKVADALHPLLAVK